MDLILEPYAEKSYRRALAKYERLGVAADLAEKEALAVAEVRHSAETLLSMIHENGGSLPLNDDSDPAEIAARTQMSKKVFKRSLGMLLKRGAVEITQNGVKLTGHNG